MSALNLWPQMDTADDCFWRKTKTAFGDLSDGCQVTFLVLGFQDLGLVCLPDSKSHFQQDPVGYCSRAFQHLHKDKSFALMLLFTSGKGPNAS